MEGQVRGIARMIEREEYCVDILQQTAALRAAVDALSILILEDHVSGCVRTAAERGNADEYVDEVIEVLAAQAPDAMKERSLPLPGGCWKLPSIRLHQEIGRPQWRQRMTAGRSWAWICIAAGRSWYG